MTIPSSPAAPQTARRCRPSTGADGGLRPTDVVGAFFVVLGASQFFLGAFLATDPPPRALIRAQLGCWNAGAILLVRVEFRRRG